MPGDWKRALPDPHPRQVEEAGPYFAKVAGLSVPMLRLVRPWVLAGVASAARGLWKRQASPSELPHQRGSWVVWLRVRPSGAAEPLVQRGGGWT